MLRARQLVEACLEARLLAAQCLLRSGDHQECLQVLGGWSDADVLFEQQVGLHVPLACSFIMSDQISA